MQTAPAGPGRPLAAAPGLEVDPAGQVRALADLATEMIEAGDIELALRLLAEAVRAGSGDHRPEPRPAPVDVIRAVPGEGGLTALPRLLAQQTGDAIAAAGGGDEGGLAGGGRPPALGQAAAMIGQAMIAGMRGDDALAERLARHAEAVLLPARIGVALAGIQFVRGVTAIGARRYDEAFDHLSRMFDRADPAGQAGSCAWALGDLAEAAARTGRTGEAREIADQFRPAQHDPAQHDRVQHDPAQHGPAQHGPAQHGPAQHGAAQYGPAGRDQVSPWTRVALLYAAPLLADPDEAERDFRRALEADLARWPFYRARLLLEYGSWLRRRRRIAEARAPLRHAHQVCAAHGLRPWAERARQELRATGERRVAFPAGARIPLSPQELQIARLAADGLSNREIGQRLYLSHRTIGSHLYRIFPKLGITSRAQLGSALAALPPSAGWTR